ncbi:hypothetical protein BG011_005316 [Mortierella polycephala]|uniref:CoA-transferase family III n=1 Tax=Mortierella polycephala TaxID=41804 RepID=A0A9P6PVU1_9FUNG|nr:hypothetical protein BG011_005316 [Mortierella polycephala]
MQAVHPARITTVLPRGPFLSASLVRCTTAAVTRHVQRPLQSGANLQIARALFLSSKQFDKKRDSDQSKDILQDDGHGPLNEGITIESLLSKTHQESHSTSTSNSNSNSNSTRTLEFNNRSHSGAGSTEGSLSSSSEPQAGPLDGAEVIKIENPKGGDDTRAWGPPFAKNKDPTDPVQESAYFFSVNRNKKSITVNIRSEHGQKLLQDLVKKVDILVENYVPGKLDEMGLGYKQLSALNPRLIYTSITGEENGTPVKVGVAVTDLTTGLYAHGAIMAAIIARYRTGRGQHIDCSLLDSQVVTLANIGSSYLIAGQEAKRMGTSHPSIVPYQVLPSRDSHIMIGAGNDGQFKILCSVLGLEELCENPAYKSNTDRVRNRKELIKILTERLKTKNNDEWLKALEGRGIPFAPINNIAQTFAHPQVVARDMIQEIEHPKAGKIKLAGPAVKYSETMPSIRIPPPLLGQHTEEVLRDVLGYGEERIRELKQSKVV